MPTPVISLDPLAQLLDALTQWTAFAEEGITVSICCGPSSDAPYCWSVAVMARDGRGVFGRPYEATSLPHAIAIARTEVQRRGWLMPPA